MVVVAQLVRALLCESRGRGFESRHPPIEFMKSNFMKKTLLFDFAGVIGSESYFGWIKKNIPNFVERKAEFQAVADKGDLGQVSSVEFFELVSQVTGIPSQSVWQEIYEPVTINAELVSFIRKLKNDHSVVLFSNYHADLLRRLLNKYQILDLFDEVFISSEQQVKKPDKSAFVKILHHLKVEASSVIFIDDRLENVEAGKRHGIHSIQFFNVSQLDKELKQLR